MSLLVATMDLERRVNVDATTNLDQLVASDDCRAAWTDATPRRHSWRCGRATAGIRHGYVPGVAAVGGELPRLDNADCVHDPECSADPRLLADGGPSGRPGRSMHSLSCSSSTSCCSAQLPGRASWGTAAAQPDLVDRLGVLRGRLCRADAAVDRPYVYTSGRTSWTCSWSCCRCCACCVSSSSCARRFGGGEHGQDRGLDREHRDRRRGRQCVPDVAGGGQRRRCDDHLVPKGRLVGCRDNDDGRVRGLHPDNTGRACDRDPPHDPGHRTDRNRQRHRRCVVRDPRRRWNHRLVQRRTTPPVSELEAPPAADNPRAALIARLDRLAAPKSAQEAEIRSIIVALNAPETVVVTVGSPTPCDSGGHRQGSGGRGFVASRVEGGHDLALEVGVRAGPGLDTRPEAV